MREPHVISDENNRDHNVVVKLEQQLQMRTYQHRHSQMKAYMSFEHLRKPIYAWICDCIFKTHRGQKTLNKKEKNMDFYQGCVFHLKRVSEGSPGWLGGRLSLSRKLASPKVTSTDGREATVWNVSGQRSDIVVDCVLWQLLVYVKRVYQTHAHLS